MLQADVLGACQLHEHRYYKRPNSDVETIKGSETKGGEGMYVLCILSDSHFYIIILKRNEFKVNLKVVMNVKVSMFVT